MFSLLSDDDLRVVRALPSGASYREVDRVFREAGWVPCGVGDWAFAVRSPGGRFAARISPFDPAAPYSAALYRQAAHTRQVPVLEDFRQLEGGASLTVMEYLDPVGEAEAMSFHCLIADRATEVAELVEHIAAVHAVGEREQPWWGPLDDNPANVMRGSDGRLVVTDLFYANGPDLYATARNDPDRVARAFPESMRRYMTEVPLSSSGGWRQSEREQMRVMIAEADARNSP